MSNDASDRAGPAGQVKIVAVLHRKVGTTPEQFVDHWRSKHPAYVCRLPGLRAYRQNTPLPHRRSWPFDGVAELWFDSVRDVAAAFDSPAADDMRADERHFVASIEWVLAAEADVDVVSFGSRLVNDAIVQID
jgi:uncharacterized protein (TIGR02118 family)